MQHKKITVVYSSHLGQNFNNNFNNYLIESSGLKKDNIQILPYENYKQYSLTEVYNKGLNESLNDIIVFCHNDIKIEKNWGLKLLNHFNKSTHDIIGVAGSVSMSRTGRWWDNPADMRGIVKHTHEGKTWENRYSESQGYNIKDVVILDGLFFAINKNNIKHNFDEDFKGFHFYDLGFCYPNYLAGVKLGVVTDIRVTHMSIGQTNQEWEENRKLFVEKYSEELIKNKKLSVLIGCLNYSTLTGSELYVYELAKELVKQNVDVSICSNIGEPLKSLSKEYDIKLYSLSEPPGFKLGDGSWGMNTENGYITSQPNMLYKVNNIEFDILHLNHKPITEHLLKLYPNTPVVTSIHSEVISLEEPVLSEQIKKYIAIRPEIKEHLINKFEISEDKIEVIYNPIDYNRFNTNYKSINNNKKRVIFVGTLDYLRKESILDLIKTTRNNNQELWLVGKENGVTVQELKLLDGFNCNHIKYHKPTINVEELVKQCDETAGILLGRTTIEGWLCGKPAWIYNIDNQGKVLNKTFNEIPTDIEKFRSDNVTKNIIEIYKNAISN